MNRMAVEMLKKLLSSSEANLMAARIILDEISPVDDDGNCKHPTEALRQVHTFGAKLVVCTVCGDFVQGHENV